MKERQSSKGVEGIPFVENDVIFAYLNEYDSNHAIGERIFQKLQDGEVRW